MLEREQAQLVTINPLKDRKEHVSNKSTTAASRQHEASTLQAAGVGHLSGVQRKELAVRHTRRQHGDTCTVFARSFCYLKVDIIIPPHCS